MNHRDTANSEKRAIGVFLALCALCLLWGANAVGATENWPVTYNHGVTAYRSNDYAAAAATFEQSTAAPDQSLQEKALYNLGNAQYRLGQVVEPQSLEQAIPVFKKSLQAYERALATDPKDADAKFNHALVKKKIAELEKKQEQQRQQQQQQKPQDDQQQKQDQQQQKGDQQQQQPAGKEDQQQKPPQNQQPPDSRKDEKPQSAQQKPPEQGQQPQSQEAKQAAGQENFDKQRAAAMLDNLREDERNWNFFPEVQMQDLKDKGESVKDW